MLSYQKTAGISTLELHLPHPGVNRRLHNDFGHTHHGQQVKQQCIQSHWPSSGCVKRHSYEGSIEPVMAFLRR